MTQEYIIFSPEDRSRTNIQYAETLADVIDKVKSGDTVMLRGKVNEYLDIDMSAGGLIVVKDHGWTDDMKSHLYMLQGKIEITHLREKNGNEWITRSCKICIKALRQRNQYKALKTQNQRTRVLV